MSTLDAASQPDATRDLWQVRLPSGEVCTMSLDELDAAFQAGRIDEETPLLQAGATEWARLRDLAGLEEAPTLPPQPPQCPQTPAPFAVDLPSVRPLSSDVALVSASSDRNDDLDLPSDAFRPGKRKTVMAAGVAIGVLLGVVLALTQIDASPDSGVVAAGVVTAVESTLPPVVAAPPPPAPAPVAAPAQIPSTDPSARLSGDQRKALLEVDRAHSQQRKVRSVPSHGAVRTNGKPVFHKGGNKFDPLNSSL